MKMYVAVVAACLIACAHALPSARRDSSEEDFDDLDNISFNFAFPDFFSDTFNRMRHNLMNLFWNIPSITDMQIPEGANTTSTTKIINGHVVTINETTYTSGDENGGTAFRIRIIDVKPENETLTVIGGGNAEPTTVKAEASGSAETVEDFNNEIPNKTDVLTA